MDNGGQTSLEKLDFFKWEHSSGRLRTPTTVVEEHHASRQAYSAIGVYHVGAGSKNGSNAMERNGTVWDCTPVKVLNNGVLQDGLGHRTECSTTAGCRFDSCPTCPYKV